MHTQILRLYCAIYAVLGINALIHFPPISEYVACALYFALAILAHRLYHRQPTQR